MHGIGVVGLSWKQRRPDLLAAFTIPKDARAERLPQLAEAIGARELVYVATCNRVELAFTTDGAGAMPMVRRRVFAALAGREPGAAEADHFLRAWQGEGAVEHLFLLVSGLDSARVGESEITGQVKDAVEQSRAAGLLGGGLEHVLAEAIKVAKRVRPMTEGRVGRASIAQVALRHVTDRLERTPGAVALLGVSPMTEQCGRELAARGVKVIVVNRTKANGDAMAQRIAGSREPRAESRTLDEFKASPDPVEVLVAATGAKEPVLDRSDLEKIAARSPSGAPLVVDLGVPPNVSPEAARDADVQRVGMDRVTDDAASDRERTLVDLADARIVIDEALVEFRRATADRLLGPMIAQLRLRYRRTALEGVERLFRRELSGLGEPEREVVRQWAETLARRFAHLPSVGLRDLIYEAGPSAVEAFVASAEPELARDLRAFAGAPDTGTRPEWS